MTSLPISLPPHYTPVVKKGDKVIFGQLLAKREQKDEKDSPQPLSTSEVAIDLSAALYVPTGDVRRFLKKAPGDSISIGDSIAEKSVGLGLKKQIIYSEISGTVSRFERDSGKLYVKGQYSLPETPVKPQKLEIFSPLAGIISVCNNDEIVIETESKTLTGSEGFGGTVTGEILVLVTEDDKPAIVSSQIVKDAIGKILLLPDIDTEALVKADAIGVAGILGTEFSKQLLAYLSSRKLDITVISIDPAIGKKLLKSKNPVILHGLEKSILLQE